jgi:aspartyl-tRNA(Asn)/glutamyl-tRNA(Gln) amidotransferase subunit A
MSTQTLPNLAEVARQLRDGTRSAVALAESCLERQQRFAPALHAYVTPTPERARALAAAAEQAFKAGADTGPLQGIPVSLKDLYALRATPTYAGTPSRLGGEWEEEGAVVRGLGAELAVVVGKTHTVELAFGGLGTNAHWGTPCNPWDARQHRVPGGSSAGAGVSLAEGSALVALGTDTAGSVRIPAAMTGCVGLKTTHGRWPTDGIFPLAPSLDTVGLLARSAADAAYAFASIESATRAKAAVPAPRDGLLGLRIGVPELLFFDDCDAGVAEAVQGGLSELEHAGAKLVRVELPAVEEVFGLFRRGGLAAAECYAFLSDRLPQLLATLDPAVADRVRDGATLSAADYLKRRARLRHLGGLAALELARVDVIATPTVALTPPLVDALADLDAYRRANRLVLRNTCIPSLLGLCALSLPVGLDAAGMPVGLQLIAGAFAEERLLAVAQACEQTLGNAAARLGLPPRVPADR